VAAVDGDRHAPVACLLALGLVDDLGPEAVSLGPPEVHPEEHLGPVGRLGAARSRVDADERAALVVVAREQELGPLAGVIALELGTVALELGAELGVLGLLDERDELDEVVGALRQVSPEGDLGPQAVGLAEDPLRGPPVVPEAGLARQLVELGEARVLGG